MAGEETQQAGVCQMKLRVCFAALGLLASACTTADVERSAVATASGLAVSACERSESCTVRDTGPRYGPEQQRVVEDTLKGRQEPM